MSNNISHAIEASEPYDQETICSTCSTPFLRTCQVISRDQEWNYRMEL